jgi:hypothetical protein
MTTIEKPLVDISTELQHAIKSQPEEQITVYVSCSTDAFGSAIRIWQSTYLYCATTGKQHKLLNADNINFFPTWLYIEPYSNHVFVLIFEKPSSSCTHFHIKEEIPENGGFEWTNIHRNNTDIYRVMLPL